MNRFLKGIGITFRRDEETKRPRVIKLDSQLDRRQKVEGSMIMLRWELREAF